eukprot:11162722-Lingulodinium_polyedra.AAC.1
MTVMSWRFSRRLAAASVAPAPWTRARSEDNVELARELEAGRDWWSFSWSPASSSMQNAPKSS